MMAHAGNAGAEDPSPFGPAEANELLCSVPEEGGHSPRAGATPFAPNLSKINSSPAVPHDHGDRTLKRSNSKSVRFSNTSSDDEDDSPGTNPDMRGEGGRRWRSLKEFCQVKVRKFSGFLSLSVYLSHTAQEVLHVDMALRLATASLDTLFAFFLIVLALGQEIYRGRVSLVASAVCKKSNQGVVLKAYIKSKLSSSLREMVEREIRVHGRVKLHDGVVEFLGWFEDEVQIVLVQEHCSGGDLYRHLVLNGGQMSEDLALREVMYPMIHALLRIHRMNICHRDLKPENMFFAVDQHGDRCLKLGDFGLASDLLEMRDRVGTLDYMAPEILLQRDESSFSMEHQMSGPEDGKKQVEAAKPYTVKVDVWAVGIIAYELLTGRPPFEVWRC